MESKIRNSVLNETNHIGRMAIVDRYNVQRHLDTISNLPIKIPPEDDVIASVGVCDEMIKALKKEVDVCDKLIDGNEDAVTLESVNSVYYELRRLDLEPHQQLTSAFKNMGFFRENLTKILTLKSKKWEQKMEASQKKKLLNKLEDKLVPQISCEEKMYFRWIKEALHAGNLKYLKKTYGDVEIEDHKTIVKWIKYFNYPCWPARVVMDMRKEKVWADSRQISTELFAKREEKKHDKMLAFFFGWNKYYWVPSVNYKIIPLTEECPNRPNFTSEVFEKALQEARTYLENEGKHDNKKRKRTTEESDPRSFKKTKSKSLAKTSTTSKGGQISHGKKNKKGYYE